jgi:hypothetical protein
VTLPAYERRPCMPNYTLAPRYQFLLGGCPDASCVNEVRSRQAAVIARAIMIALTAKSSCALDRVRPYPEFTRQALGLLCHPSACVVSGQ